MIVRMPKDNPAWEYARIEGMLANLRQRVMGHDARA
jgi:hypothetical protein